ncbi:MAG: GNAT family N-acetyltransferase [Streptosporangiaceae bacterium]
MSTKTITLARTEDLDTVLELLNAAADWLHSRNINQWPDGFGPDRIRPLIERREMYLVHDASDAVATVAMSWLGDRDFWTSAELAESAAYVSKAAVARPQAGHGLGDLLLRWVIDRADKAGARWVRLDAWRTNNALQEYYRQHGWNYVRTVQAAHRKSGALFQRLALPDHGARAAFEEIDVPTWTAPSTSREYPGIYEPGTRVAVSTQAVDQPAALAQSGVITEVHGPDWSHEILPQRWETGVGRPDVAYTVRTSEGQTMIVAEGSVTAWPQSEG